MPRDIFLIPQGVYISLKWAGDIRPNAGVISFDQLNFAGLCHVNSKEHYAHGHDQTLAEQLEIEGFNFLAPGFHGAPGPAAGPFRVKGLGSGSDFLGYRTFMSLNDARAYLSEHGLIVNPPN